MNSRFKIEKAVRTARPARICFAGPSGSGKTTSVLRVMSGLIGAEGEMMVLESERGSAKLYAGQQFGNRPPLRFDVIELPDFEPETYADAINYVVSLKKYSGLVVDSFSHLWAKVLDTSKKMTGNSFTNWGKLHARVDAATQAFIDATMHPTHPLHVACTTRAKMKYEQGEENGKKSVTPLGLDPIMKDGFEYEVDVYGMIDIEHHCTIRKSRFLPFADKIITKPGEEFGAEIAAWLASGAAASDAPAKVSNPQESEKVVPVPQFTGDPAILGDLVITTACTRQGERIADLYRDDPEWFGAALTKYRSKMTPLDISHMEAFKVHFTQGGAN